MKYLLSLALIQLTFSGKAQTPRYFNPTGTYILVSKNWKVGIDFYGYSGRIQVKKIKKSKVIVNLDVNKGAPSYNSGGFIDTLSYRNNTVVYTVPEVDKSCKIVLKFGRKGVWVKEQVADPNCGCGFGHAVVANGFFKRTSSRVPVLTNGLTGEKY